MKEDEITARAVELNKLFADIPDDVLMRFVNRSTLVCTEFDRNSILRALAGKSNSGREQLKAFLFKPVPVSLRKIPRWPWGTALKSRYEKNVTCEGCCEFDPPLPIKNPKNDGDFVNNALELVRRDRDLLKKIQQNDEILIRREILEEAEFNTACGDSDAARAESAFRDGVVRAKLAELERYVKEQMAELRRENHAWQESLRQELLQKYAAPASASRPDECRKDDSAT